MPLMRLSFNTAGPCFPDEHYMLPPERRIGEVMELIEQHKYFTLTAFRQTGKTTCGMWIEAHLNKTGEWRALWVDIQEARDQPDPAKTFRTLLGKIDRVCRLVHPDIKRPDIEELLHDLATAVGRYLSFLAGQDKRPWVILFDEADSLVGEAAASFLTQLREGYIARRRIPFPVSIAFICVHRVPDYALRDEAKGESGRLVTVPQFNICARDLRLAPFSQSDIGELLEQHTKAMGQRFEPPAMARIFELGQGHPWITNALANQIVRRDVKDRSIAITAEHVDAAKETIILERRTRIDSLASHLRDERVRKVIEPMLVGQRIAHHAQPDDFAHTLELGLIRIENRRYEIANSIYREVIPRVLSFDQQVQIDNEPAWYVKPNGSLDMGKLVADWQKFWRKDGHLAAEGFFYRESGPHLMLMAFLQRIINGGGRIEHEYGLGRGALDLLVFWKDERHAIELKIRHSSETELDAFEQVARYLDGLGLSEGWLIMFDMRKRRWEKKLYQREVEHEGKTIRLVGC